MALTLPKLLQYQDSFQKDNFKHILLELKDYHYKQYDVIELCFMLDSTGSMEKYLKLVLDSIEYICQGFLNLSIQKKCPLKIACVCYKDIKDQNQKEVFDFSESLVSFKTFLSSVKAEGGGDSCEDVSIGLKQVNNLSWGENSLRVCVWIADSPCHGAKYHGDNLTDDFLDRKENENVEEEIRKIAENNISLYFCEITNHTQKMISIFQNIYKNVCNKEIEVCEIKDSTTQDQFIQQIIKKFDTSQLLECFVKFNSQLKKITKIQNLNKLEQLSKSLERIIDIQQSRLKEEQDNIPLHIPVQEEMIKKFDSIEWEDEIDGEILTYQLSQDNSKLKISNKQNVTLKKAKIPFAKGAFKYCFITQNTLTGDVLVLKKHIRKYSFQKNTTLFEIYINLISQKIMKAFKEGLKHADLNNDLNYQTLLFIPQLNIFQSGQSFYLVEQFKLGHARYINNDGQIAENQEKMDIFESFVHFSFCYSNKNLMVTDIQGFNKQLNDIGIHSQPLLDILEKSKLRVPQEEQNIYNQKNRYNRFKELEEEEDPLQLDLNEQNLQIHSESNLGSIGIVNFFRVHKCNRYCKLLQLECFEIESLINTLESIEEQCEEDFNTSTQNIEIALKSNEIIGKTSNQSVERKNTSLSPVINRKLSKNQF